MFDMLILAFQTDSTRVATLMLAHDGSNRSFDQIGISEGHHDLTHHQNRPDWVEKVADIDLWYVRQFARFLEKLQATKDVDGQSLLHNSMIVYGSGNADGNRHTHDNLPVVLAGGGGGTLDARALRQARLQAADEPLPEHGRPPRAPRPRALRRLHRPARRCVRNRLEITSHIQGQADRELTLPARRAIPNDECERGASAPWPARLRRKTKVPKSSEWQSLGQSGRMTPRPGARRGQSSDVRRTNPLLL